MNRILRRLCVVTDNLPPLQSRQELEAAWTEQKAQREAEEAARRQSLRQRDEQLMHRCVDVIEHVFRTAHLYEEA